MKNGLYLTERDSVSFNDWFVEAYMASQPETGNRIACKNVTIVITEDCNFACTYCYMHHKTAKRMDYGTVSDVVDFLLNRDLLNGYISCEESPCVILDFIGGEPLLEIDAIDHFMDYFIYKAFQLNHPWAYNYVISMSSNGSLYNTPKVQNFIKKFKGRVHIGISIDGKKELHDTCRIYKDGRGTYDDVIKAVMLRFRNGEDPSTKITLASENLKYLAESAIHLFNIGYRFLYCNVVFEDVWNMELARILYAEMKKLANIIINDSLYEKHYISLFSESIGYPVSPEDNKNWCGGDGEMLAIGPDGTCYPCLRYMEYSFANPERKPLTIGNIQTGIIDKDESEDLKCLTCITRRSQSTKECFDCPIGSGCAWCSAFNYDCFGTADKRTTFHCPMHKARVLANVYYWNKLYQKLDLNDIYEFHMPDDWALEIVSEDELSFLKKISKKEM